MLKSRGIQAIWITQIAANWIRQLASLNLPIYINETFNLGIVKVRFIRILGV